MRRRRPAHVAVLVAVLGGCGGGGPPRLDLAEPRVTMRDDVTEVRVDVGNVGRGVLLVHGVAPGCGCRVTAALPERLVAGARTTLELACLPAGAPGEAVHTIRLGTNDPAHPEQALVVTLPIVPAAAEPRALYFGYVPVGESVTRDLTVAVPGRPPTSPSPEIVVEQDPRPGIHRVRFAPSVAGPFRSAIDLGPGVAPVPVVGVGFDGLLAFPAEVAVGAPDVRTPLVIMNVGEDPLAITGVEYPPGIRGELRQVEPGREYRLTVRVAGGPAPAGGIIRVRTDGASALVIPVRRLDG